MADLITARVDFSFASYNSARSNMDANNLRALAVDADARLAALPDVPTLTETGLGQYKVGDWFGLVAPAGTPAPVLERLNAEVRTIMTSPEIAERLSREGAEHWDISPAAFRAHVAAEIPRWKAVIETAKIKVE